MTAFQTETIVSRSKTLRLKVITSKPKVTCLKMLKIGK